MAGKLQLYNLATIRKKKSVLKLKSRHWRVRVKYVHIKNKATLWSATVGEDEVWKLLVAMEN